MEYACRIVYLSSEGVGGNLKQQTDTTTTPTAAERDA
jgi:hypothetical protein